MRLLDKIKKFFNKMWQKQLQEEEALRLGTGNMDGKLPVEDFADRIHYEPDPVNVNNKELKGVDFAIEQWIAGLIFQKENNMTLSSYRSLVELGAMTVDPNIDEENVLNQINNNKDINMVVQRSSNGAPAFYHIYKDKITKPEYRLYLNCKSNNLPQLVEKLNDKLKDLDSYYFKFNSKEQMLNKSRSEQMVFYISDDKQMSDIINKIREVKKENPELWQGAENMNPFLKNVEGFIAYAPDVVDDQYHALDGSNHTIAKSYNSLLAEALEDSLTHSVRDIASKDYNLSTKLKGNYFYNMAPYIWSNVLKDIYENDDLKAKLINSVKKNLQLAVDKNDKLEIKGIDRDKDR